MNLLFTIHYSFRCLSLSTTVPELVEGQKLFPAIRCNLFLAEKGQKKDFRYYPGYGLVEFNDFKTAYFSTKFNCFNTNSYFDHGRRYFDYGGCHFFEGKLCHTAFKSRHNPSNRQLGIING